MPSILGGIENRDRNNSKLYNIRDNSIRNCNFIFKGKIDIDRLKLIINRLYNESKTIFYFMFKDEISIEDYLDVVELTKDIFNDIYFIFYKKEQLRLLKESDIYIKHVMYYSDDYLLTKLAVCNINLCYSYLNNYDNPNIGNYIIAFKMDNMNLDVVYSAIKTLSNNNIFSFIDFKVRNQNEYYQNCDDIKENNEVLSDNFRLQLIVDKMRRESLKIWNIKTIENFINYPDKLFKCDLFQPFSLTFDENLSLNVCPLIKGSFITHIDYTNVLTEENKPTEIFRNSVEKDYNHYCEGCNNMIRMFQS